VDLAIDPSICFGSHVSAADTLTLLMKASATVTVYRGHCRTLFCLPGINYVRTLLRKILGHMLVYVEVIHCHYFSHFVHSF